MKLPCEIIQDLLFLYTDEACSPESRQAVEEHLAQCPACRQRLEVIRLPEAAEVPAPEEERRERIVKNSFRKVRRRWVVSVASVFLLLPALLLGFMGVNEARGAGIAFTNLDDIYQTRRFMGLIEHGKWEKAAECMDFESQYQYTLEILSWTPEEYSSGKMWHECTIDGKRYMVEYRRADTVGYDFEESYTGENQIMTLWNNLIFNLNAPSILIPEEVWDTVILSNGIREGLEAKFGWPLPYSLVETPWGRFYVQDSVAKLWGMGEIQTALDLFYQLEYIVPYEIYEEALPDMRQQAQEAYQWNQELYGPAADMTQEEFVQYMREKMVRLLEQGREQGTILSGLHYKDAMRLNGEWRVEISGIETLPDGQTGQVSYEFCVRDGQICYIGGRRSGPMTEDPIGKALRVSFGS